jgi:hypothetical protein
MRRTFVMLRQDTHHHLRQVAHSKLLSPFFTTSRPNYRLLLFIATFKLCRARN